MNEGEEHATVGVADSPPLNGDLKDYAPQPVPYSSACW